MVNHIRYSFVVSILTVVSLFGVASAVLAAEPDVKGIEFFESKIRPVLVKHCYECHSGEAVRLKKLKGGLLLDSQEGLLRGGETGPALVVEKPAESLLIKSLKHEADAPQMPPNEKLSAAIVGDFVEWIKMGAPDPRRGDAGVVIPKKGMSLEEGRRLWSMQTPVKAELPPVTTVDWARGPIDLFVLAAMEGQSFVPAADASRASWLRRVTFDLTGLPPSVAELDEFLADAAPDAESKIVDRLLDSSHFGERWGRHWLDAARYSDSNGRDRNVFWYSAWRYRDYVIAAFNRDLPYDQFLREQVAGDLMSAATDEERDRLRTATGFLALGPKAFEEIKPEIFRMDVIDEQIDVIGRSVLGLSIACARCHDHKFDPIPTRDYYSLAGIFRSTQPLYGYGPKGIKAANHTHTPLYAVGPDRQLGEAGLAYIENLNVLTLKQNVARSDRYRVVRKLADAKLRIEKPDADKAALQADIDRMEAEIKDWDVTVKAAEAELKAATETPPPMPGWAMGARERDQPEDARIHIRGETTNLGESVPRGTLQVLPNSPAAMPADRSGRLELADWLTAKSNPLTARVAVNRMWLHLFGRGLVTTADDFGVNGARPSHPQLLDYLAVRFMEFGWSNKQMIREIVLSRTYRMSADANATGLMKDPDNVFLWRMSPRRLDAESIRDAILATNGQLDRTPKADVPYPVPLSPWKTVEYFNFENPFLPAQIEHRQRSVYLPVVRGVLPPIFQLFDFASPDRPVAQRDESTVPAQSLYLLNNGWVIEQARLLADNLLQEADQDDAARLSTLYRRALSRLPTEQETDLARSYLATRESLLPDPKAKQPVAQLTEIQQRRERWISYCQALLASAEFRVLR